MQQTIDCYLEFQGIFSEVQKRRIDSSISWLRIMDAIMLQRQRHLTHIKYVRSREAIIVVDRSTDKGISAFFLNILFQYVLKMAPCSFPVLLLQGHEPCQE